MLVTRTRENKRDGDFGYVPMQIEVGDHDERQDSTRHAANGKKADQPPVDRARCAMNKCTNGFG